MMKPAYERASESYYQGYWNATTDITDFPELSGDERVDVAIVGGGIVGITAARLLKDRGLTVAVLEARKVGRQVTGKSTAKVTAQHGLAYQRLEAKFGRDGARLYAEAQLEGIRTIRSFSAKHAIDCDLEARDAYVYSADDNSAEELEQEEHTAKAIGLPAQLVKECGLPFPIRAALRLGEQFQFHPTKYVCGLARSIPGDGSAVFENSRVEDWNPNMVETARAGVRASCVIMATHLPLGRVGGFFAEAYPRAEPVVAARIPCSLEGMYISADSPRHSIRSHTGDDGEIYAIAVGEAFKPGNGMKERQSFSDLEGWLSAYFASAPPTFRWTNEDYSSMDGAPFVGWSSPREAYLIATGFNAWGISNGTAAAIMLADLVTDRKNPWLELFDARRIKPLAGGPKFLAENAAVAGHWIGGYLKSKQRDIDALKADTAAIMKIDGETLGIFKDERGKLHAVSATCSHMGCQVGWNEVDRTWDCPCHGSRFGLDGEVLHGPATSPLRLVTTEDK